MDDKLTSFVDHAKTKGIDLAIIRQLLISSGWRDADVAAAFWPRELNLPVPTPSRRGEPRSQARRRPASPWPRRAREAFLHLLTFGALFTWATTLFLLTFSFIDFDVPGSRLATEPGHARRDPLGDALADRHAHRRIPAVPRPLALSAPRDPPRPREEKRLKRPLPATLDDLARIARSERINLAEPETGRRYGYTVTSRTMCELCASFSLERSADVEVFWNHSPGKHCFSIDALDPP